MWKLSKNKLFGEKFLILQTLFKSLLISSYRRVRSWNGLLLLLLLWKLLNQILNILRFSCRRQRIGHLFDPSSKPISNSAVQSLHHLFCFFFRQFEIFVWFNKRVYSLNTASTRVNEDCGCGIYNLSNPFLIKLFLTGSPFFCNKVFNCSGRTLHFIWVY